MAGTCTPVPATTQEVIGTTITYTPRNREEFFVNGVRHVMCGACQDGRYLLGLIDCGKCTHPTPSDEPCECCGYSDAKMLAELWVRPQIGAVT